MIKADKLPALRDRLKTIIREELSLAYFDEDSDGDFRFKFERNGYLLLFDETDPAFVWLRGDRRLPSAEERDLPRIDSLINEANRMCKGVKLWRGKYDDGVHYVCASISFLVDEPAAITAGGFERYLCMVGFGQKTFGELYNSDELPIEDIGLQIGVLRTH